METSESPLVKPGQKSELFRLKLNNYSNDSVSIINLKFVDVLLPDRYGQLISPDEILNLSGSGFYSTGDSFLTIGTIINQKLRLRFNNYNINPGAQEIVKFIAEFHESLNVNEFSLKISNENISAIYLNGPRAGQEVKLNGEFGGDFTLGGNFIVTEGSLKNSLMVNNNPFNPEDGTGVDIAYYLEEETDVTINIFTLLGEEVYRQIYPAGSNGGLSGQNTINWDGRNDKGRLVLNGVYIISIEPFGSKAERLKVAVLK